MAVSVLKTRLAAVRAKFRAIETKENEMKTFKSLAYCLTLFSMFI